MVEFASVLFTLISKARQTLLGTITSILIRFGNLTSSGWF